MIEIFSFSSYLKNNHEREVIFARCVMKSQYVTVLERELHFTEWGTRNANDCAPSVVCWHGLARTCRDFDLLASKLASSGYHVICPDTIGRGLSQWSPAPEQEYNVFFYIKLAKALLDALTITEVYWFGTSMGGMIGYMGASNELKPYIKKLILNDIGPRLNPVAITRILSYASVPPVFSTVRELETFMEKAYQSFGIHDPALLRFLVEVGSRRLDDGRVTTHYDPKVIDALKVGCYTGVEGLDDVWALYDKVTCETLTIRGSTSDLFLPDALEEMTQRGPKTRVAIVDGVGHAPAMNTEEQMSIVTDFFAGVTA